MLESLLILILFTNPAVEEDAQAFSNLLGDYANRKHECVLGAAAQKHLAELVGIGSDDLIAAGAIGKTLTKQKPIILIHIDRRSVNGDAILEAKLWYDGREESYVSIAGNERNPLPGLFDGCMQMVGYLLRVGNAQNGNLNTARVSLAQLAKENAWEQLLGRVAAIPSDERVPMIHYYQVMAYVNLKQRDAAVAALNAFRKQYKDHILVTSAETLIPPKPRSDDELIDLGGGETMDPLFEGNDDKRGPQEVPKKEETPAEVKAEVKAEDQAEEKVEAPAPEKEKSGDIIIKPMPAEKKESEAEPATVE